MTHPVLIQSLESRLFLNSAPLLDAVTDLQVPQDKYVFVPLTAYDEDGDALQWTITSSDPDVVEVIRHDANPWMELTVKYGQTTSVMVFQLFKDLAPITVDSLIGLVNAGYYDGLSIDSISSADGWLTAGASDSVPFILDDEYNAQAIFNGYGQLGLNSYAKDQNTPEFFITADEQRDLDFNKTCFGQLVRGDDVLEELMTLGVDGDGVPTDPVTILSAKMVPNPSDVVISLFGKGSGTATIQLSVSDGAAADSVSFDASIFHDAKNNHPFLGPISPVVVSPEELSGLQTQTIDEVDYILLPPITLSSTDLEGNNVTYAATLLPVDGATHGVVETVGNQTTVKVLSGYVGRLRLFITCFGADFTQFDPQEISIVVGGYSIDASAGNFPSVRNFSRERVLGTFTTQDPGALPGAFTTTLQWGDGYIDEGTVVKSNGVFKVYGAHAYERSGEYTFALTIEDSLGVVSVARSTITVSDFGVGPDLTKPGKQSLYINGTDGNDLIRISRAAQGYAAYVNGDKIGVFNVTGRIYVLGHAGADRISAGSKLDKPCVFDGGDGKDSLVGGAKPDLLFGGWGKDTLVGNDGNDLLIGGDDADWLYGNAGFDALIPGWTDYDESLVDQIGLYEKWTRLDKTYPAKSREFIRDPRLIHDDYSRDLMKGGLGWDLFVSKPIKAWNDLFVDRLSAEFSLR